MIKKSEPLKMKGHVTNIEKETKNNNNFRKVVYTGKNIQLVLMTVLPGESIGEEVHDTDQFFRVEQGRGIAEINNNIYVISDGFSVLVPQGARHNIINNANVPLRLYTLYAPPHHQDKIVFKTKREAMMSNEKFDGKTTEEG